VRSWGDRLAVVQILTRVGVVIWVVVQIYRTRMHYKPDWMLCDEVDVVSPGEDAVLAFL
jgi:hypothetical protein